MTIRTIEPPIDIDETRDDDEPTTEEHIEMLKEALREAETGQTRPVEELLLELDEIVAGQGACPDGRVSETPLQEKSECR